MLGLPVETASAVSSVSQLGVKVADWPVDNFSHPGTQTVSIAAHRLAGAACEAQGPSCLD
jgi:hypothetical protein